VVLNQREEESLSCNTSVVDERMATDPGMRSGSKAKKRGDKQTNTIMQQINNFSLTPMNDVIAEKTIEDHKYLLEHVENRCAIAYFAAANRNLSLFNALQHYFEALQDVDLTSDRKLP